MNGRSKQAGHTEAPEPARSTLEKPLASEGAFSNRASLVKPFSYRPARVMVLSAVSVSRRNIWSGRKRGCCKVHNGFALICAPNAPGHAVTHTLARGRYVVRLRGDSSGAMPPTLRLTSETARQTSKRCGG